MNNYVRARAGEIAANIVHQIELSEIATSELGAGIVLTGGGAKLPGFGRQLAEQSKLPLRNADMPDNITFASAELASTDNIDVAAILASAAATTDLEGLSPMPEEETVQPPRNVRRAPRHRHPRGRAGKRQKPPAQMDA